MQSRLATNLQKSSCLCLWSTSFAGLGHITQLEVFIVWMPPFLQWEQRKSRKPPKRRTKIQVGKELLNPGGILSGFPTYSVFPLLRLWYLGLKSDYSEQLHSELGRSIKRKSGALDPLAHVSKMSEVIKNTLSMNGHSRKMNGLWKDGRWLKTSCLDVEMSPVIRVCLL